MEAIFCIVFIVVLWGRTVVRALIAGARRYFAENVG